MNPDTYNNFTREEFINYLKAILIPSLVESGYTATAEDFDTALYFLTTKESESQ